MQTFHKCRAAANSNCPKMNAKQGTKIKSKDILCNANDGCQSVILSNNLFQSRMKFVVFSWLLSLSEPVKCWVLIASSILDPVQG